MDTKARTELTKEINDLISERRECKEAGLPSDDVDTGIKQLQQKRNRLI